MSSTLQDNSDRLLRIIVQRHLKQPTSRTLVGETIAHESRTLRRANLPASVSTDDVGDLIADRLARRFLQHRRPTALASVGPADTLLAGSAVN
jgi:hypothetical protein